MFSERRVCDLHVTFELIGEWGVEIVPVALLFILMFSPFWKLRRYHSRPH